MNDFNINWKLTFYTFDEYGNYTGVHEHVTGSPIPRRKTTVKPPSNPVGYLVWNGSEWKDESKPARESVTVRKENMYANLANIRWNRETGGVVFNGLNIPTDDRTTSKLTAVRIVATEDSTYTVNWKVGNQFFPLDAPTIIAISDTVRQHVQDCFDREAVLIEQINTANTHEELDNIDLSSGWPGQEE